MAYGGPTAGNPAGMMRPSGGSFGYQAELSEDLGQHTPTQMPQVPSLGHQTLFKEILATRERIEQEIRRLDHRFEMLEQTVSDLWQQHQD